MGRRRICPIAEPKLDTPSLGADAFTAAEYGVGQSRRREWTRAAVAIAREASAGQKFVIGAVGPSVDLLSYVARHSFEEHVEAFTEQIRDLWESHVDAIHLAYHLDSKMLQAALRGVAAVPRAAVVGIVEAEVHQQVVRPVVVERRAEE